MNTRSSSSRNVLGQNDVPHTHTSQPIIHDLLNQEVNNNINHTVLDNQTYPSDIKNKNDVILHTIFSSLSPGIWFKLIGRSDCEENDNISNHLGVPAIYLMPFLVEMKILKKKGDGLVVNCSFLQDYCSITQNKSIQISRYRRKLRRNDWYIVNQSPLYRHPELQYKDENFKFPPRTTPSNQIKIILDILKKQYEKNNKYCTININTATTIDEQEKNTEDEGEDHHNEVSYEPVTTMTKRKRHNTRSSSSRNVLGQYDVPHTHTSQPIIHDPFKQEVNNNIKHTVLDNQTYPSDIKNKNDEILHTIFSSLSPGIWFKLIGRSDCEENDNISDHLGIPAIYLMPFLVEMKILKKFGDGLGVNCASLQDYCSITQNKSIQSSRWKNSKLRRNDWYIVNQSPLYRHPGLQYNDGNFKFPPRTTPSNQIKIILDILKKQYEKNNINTIRIRGYGTSTTQEKNTEDEGEDHHNEVQYFDF